MECLRNKLTPVCRQMCPSTGHVVLFESLSDPTDLMPPHGATRDLGAKDATTITPTTACCFLNVLPITPPTPIWAPCFYRETPHISPWLSRLVKRTQTEPRGSNALSTMCAKNPPQKPMSSSSGRRLAILDWEKAPPLTKGARPKDLQPLTLWIHIPSQKVLGPSGRLHK